MEYFYFFWTSHYYLGPGRESSVSVLPRKPRSSISLCYTAAILEWCKSRISLRTIQFWFGLCDFMVFRQNNLRCESSHSSSHADATSDSTSHEGWILGWTCHWLPQQLQGQKVCPYLWQLCYSMLLLALISSSDSSGYFYVCLPGTVANCPRPAWKRRARMPSTPSSASLTRCAAPMVFISFLFNTDLSFYLSGKRIPLKSRDWIVAKKERHRRQHGAEYVTPCQFICGQNICADASNH